MVNPNETIDYNGTETMIKDLPSSFLRAEFGFGHFPWDVTNREIHQGIGMYDPETCLEADNTKGVWINFGENLVCQGCGLDFT
jgi:hypothetical protein